MTRNVRPLREQTAGLNHENLDILLKYQQDCINDQSGVLVVEKSRQIGFSWTAACKAVLTAAPNTGRDIWYMGYNREMGMEFISDCAKWAKALYRLAAEIEETEIFDEDEKKNVQVYRIRFPGGHKITVLPSKASTLRSKRGDVYIDEAAFHENLEKVLKAAMALRIWGGKVFIFSSHNGDDNPFAELVNDIRAGRLPYRLEKITFDNAIADGLCKRVFQVTGREWTIEAQQEWRQQIYDEYGDNAGEELDCIPKNSGGAYLSRALVESCMNEGIPVIRWECKPEFVHESKHIREAETDDFLEEQILPLLEQMPNLPTYFGQDFGRSGDLTVFFPVQQQQALRLRAPFILELRNVPFAQQQQILFWIVHRLPRFSGGALDARGNGQYLAEAAMQEFGQLLIEQVFFTERWYGENFPKYKACFEDRTIEIPKDADILADHRQIKVIRGVPRVPDSRTTGKDKGNRHGDSAISGVLAVYAWKYMDAGPVAVSSRRRRESAAMVAGY